MESLAKQLLSLLQAKVERGEASPQDLELLLRCYELLNIEHRLRELEYLVKDYNYIHLMELKENERFKRWERPPRVRVWQVTVYPAPADCEVTLLFEDGRRESFMFASNEGDILRLNPILIEVRWLVENPPKPLRIRIYGWRL